MPYFTAAHVRIALQRLPDSTHQALITFLTMLRSDIPMDDTAAVVSYGSDQENRVLRDYFAPAGGTHDRPFYIPFGPSTQGNPRWKTDVYSGTSLQRMRTGSHAIEIYRKEGTGYALRANLRDALLKPTIAKRTVGNIPISIHLLVAWMYRQKEVASHTAAIEEFANEFRVKKLHLDGLIFSLAEDPQLSVLPLATSPLTDEEVTALIEPLELPSPNLAGTFPGLAEESEEIESDGVSVGQGSWEITLSSLEAQISDLQGVRNAAVQALAALRAGTHVVLTGPPGCGKTELAKRICKAAGFDPWIVTATDSWTTFETIGGYFPQLEGDQERLDFEPGAVVASMQHGKVLVIDEINRADIDKAFGELFTFLGGSDVDLSHRRRVQGLAGGRRIRLVSGGNTAPPDVEPVHMPSWWRIIGAMNDADKASLKRLSFAFVRRFAFVSVGLPTHSEYAALIDRAAAAASLTPARQQFVASLKTIFADPSGLESIGLPMGFAIPKAMISQAVSEIGVDPARSDVELLASALDLYLAPQFQGWADKHEAMVRLAKAHLNEVSLTRFERTLATWTGFVP